jgi:hypothetical protein
MELPAQLLHFPFGPSQQQSLLFRVLHPKCQLCLLLHFLLREPQDYYHYQLTKVYLTALVSRLTQLPHLYLC